MKQLRTIVKEYTIRAPSITNAQLMQKNCYVYSGSNILFIIPADKILGWNGQAITIRLAGYDITYDNTGTQLSIVTTAMR